MRKVREFVRVIVIYFYQKMLTGIYGMHIHPSARISFGARLDKTNPKGVHVGAESYITSGALVLAHDFSRGMRADTVIGKRCFIGANAIIMCGIRIGDNVIVGGGQYRNERRSFGLHCGR